MAGTGRDRGWIVGSDLAVIARDVGALLLMQAALMGVTVLVALAFTEFYVAAAFLAAGAVTAVVGGGARRTFADAPDPAMKHGMIIAAAGWFGTALFGALAFFLAAHVTPPAAVAEYVPAGADYGSSLYYFRNPLHAVFESMSGWTGSGLTMAVHEPTLPRAVQWYRSLIQYVGGVGVIVLTTAILARPGSGSYTLYRAEAREDRIHPSVVSTVRTVWKIFFGYTLIAIGLLFLSIVAATDLPAGTALWQAINHAMTALSTGGFSVTDNSIATYDSVLIETVLLPIMTLGAIAFPIHYAVLRDADVSLLGRDLQTRWLLVLLVGGSVLLSAQNVVSLVLPAGAAPGAFAEWIALPLLPAGSADAIRDSTFQVVSGLSCTGFQSAPIGDWSDGGKLIVSATMVLGGAAGSTVGGIKIIRGYLVARGIRFQFARVFLPASAVVTVRVGDRRLDRDEMNREFAEAAIVTVLWLVLLIVGSGLLSNLVGPDFTFADAVFEVASAQGNVGLSTGITGPTMSPLAESLFVVHMWVGRLEIIPVLVFFRSLLYGLD